MGTWQDQDRCAVVEHLSITGCLTTSLMLLPHWERTWNWKCNAIDSRRRVIHGYTVLHLQLTSLILIYSVAWHLWTAFHCKRAQTWLLKIQGILPLFFGGKHWFLIYIPPMVIDGGLWNCYQKDYQSAQAEASNSICNQIWYKSLEKRYPTVWK